MCSNDDCANCNYDILEEDTPDVSVLVIINIVKTVRKSNRGLGLVDLSCELIWTDVAHQLLVQTLGFWLLFLYNGKVDSDNLIRVGHKALRENVGCSSGLEQSFDVIFLSLHSLVLESESGSCYRIVVIEDNV